MLIILGAINLYNLRHQLTKALKTSRLSAIWRIARRIIHQHPHSHLNQKDHSHLHLHIKSKMDSSPHHLSLFQIFRPIFIGLIHGLAGSTAVALLILTTIHKTAFAAFYLIVFNIGVVIGMMIITTFLGASIKLANKKITFIHKYLVVGSGLLSFAFGLYIMYQIGFVDGLFI